LIVDTSALMAVTLAEPPAKHLRKALHEAANIILPAPVLTETWLVTGSHTDGRRDVVQRLIAVLLDNGAHIAPFEHRHADITATARDLYGKGNGKGGRLNFGDLMVYAIAKERGQPLLCTGSDFASTDLVLHPASRPTP
jgi:ribonuclease VapC